jgi:hypothetical protein
MTPEFNIFVSEINSPKITKIEPFELKRKLDKTSRVKPAILHYSHLNLLMAYAESHHEAKVILTLEYDKEIKCFLTQPATFTIEVDGKMVPHTPDIVVIYHDGTVEFIQIKPEKKAKNKEYLRRFNQLVKFFKKELGVNYTLRTEESFGEGKYIENLQQLYAYLDVKLTLRTTNKIMTELPSSMTISALEHLCIKHKKTDIYAWALIAQGHFSYDCSKILTKKSSITPTH